MQHQMTYGTTTIEYTLIRKPDKKEVSISVDMYEGVRVVAPQSLEQAQLDEIMYNKAPWILKKQFGFREIEEQLAYLEFLSGEKIRYLGRTYRLKVTKKPIHKPTLHFKNGKFNAELPHHYNQVQQTTELKALCIEWYKAYGTAKIQERIRRYSKLMGLTPTSLLLKDQEKRWGSCTQKGELLINWRIMMAPLRIVDYVVVHEMAHLKIPDHSEAFWSFIRSVIPDYEERKEWLRVNGPMLNL
ncbi:SprT family zinc-dependent metalloprotease [Paenibacillus sp. FSL E2-0178]|uniref:M48 family metallopeptidase n=1 Tax=Paenibacillus sp. FSL E2-0178 TaxID=2921361 RepID=UPI00315838D9